MYCDVGLDIYIYIYFFFFNYLVLKWLLIFSGRSLKNNLEMPLLTGVLYERL
jgi:hypothetical protein